MFEFKILKKSKKSFARLGILKTSYGEIETPAFVGVATQAAVKAIPAELVCQAQTQILICNTFHLHLRPGEAVVKEAGGLHQFMNWKRPLMTDSGGFQVFSLGFGRDYGMGKILKKKPNIEIKIGQQPKLIKITGDGVLFRSYVDGRKIFLGPKESIRIQEKLGADIIFAFDECTPPIADHKYTKTSLIKTHEWAKVCLDTKKSKQALFGVVQGGKYKDLRIESAKFIGSLDFDGFGIGGEFGNEKITMTQTLNWVNKELPEEKPRHLLGIGYLEDIPKIIKEGIDSFDCIVPTHYARRGIGFIEKKGSLTHDLNRVDLSKSIYLKDKKPIDAKCDCFVCQNYRRNYISHLIKAGEITGMELLSFHNMYFFNKYVKKIREQIKKGIV